MSEGFNPHASSDSCFGGLSLMSPIHVLPPPAPALGSSEANVHARYINQIAMFARHIDAAQAKRKFAEARAEKAATALSHVTSILQATEAARDSALAKQKESKQRLEAELKRIGNVDQRMLEVVKREQAIERERAAHVLETTALLRELDDVKKGYTRQLEHNKRLEYLVKAKAISVEQAVSDYHQKFREQDSSIRGLRETHSSMVSQLGEKEQVVAQASARIRQLQEELEDCKLVMYKAIGCTSSSDSGSALSPSQPLPRDKSYEALQREALTSKRRLAEVVVANSRLIGQLEKSSHELARRSTTSDSVEFSSTKEAED